MAFCNILSRLNGATLLIIVWIGHCMHISVLQIFAYVLAFCIIMPANAGASQFVTTSEMLVAVERLEKCLRSDVRATRRQAIIICGIETYSRSRLDDQLMILRRLGYKVDSWENIDKNATIFFFRINSDEQIGVCVVRVGTHAYVDSVGIFIH